MGFNTKMFLVTPYDGKQKPIFFSDSLCGVTKFGQPVYDFDYKKNKKVPPFTYIKNKKVMIEKLQERCKHNGEIFNVINCELIAVVNLCSAPSFPTLDDSPSPTYASIIQKDDTICKDEYLIKMELRSPANVLEAMELANEKAKYRRLDIAIGVLKAAIGKFDDLRVCFYHH